MSEPTSTPQPVGLKLDSRPVLESYLKGDIMAACLTLLAHLDQLKNVCIINLDAGVREYLDDLCHTLSYLMTRTDFVIPRELGSRFIGCNEIIANAFALSNLKTTDAALKVALTQPDNLIKLLALLSPRNHLKVDRKILFDQDPHLATVWYYSFSGSTHCYLADEVALANLVEHYRYVDPRMNTLTIYVNHIYFGVTYFAPELNAPVKYTINQIVRRTLSHLTVRNTPAPGRKKILVLTDRWFTGHVVYRNYYNYLKAHAEDYEMVLVGYSGAKAIEQHVDKSLFSDVRYITVDGGAMNLDAVKDNDFHAAIFMDVGMSLESIFTANIRLAPIQIAWCGHPVSTYGAEIDYFVASRELFETTDSASEFSERLLLVPGVGAVPMAPKKRPRYTPKNLETFVINCPWTAQKTNYHHLKLLRRVIDRVKRKICFQFFPLMTITKNNGYLTFVNSIRETLGEEHTLVHRVQNEGYLQEIDKGELMVESAPFGGFNSVLDSLYLGKPAVVLEGRYLYSRLGTVLLNRAGLPELLATTPDEFVDKIVRLIEDDDYRHELSFRIAQMDIFGLLYDESESVYFKKATDYAFANHERLQASPSRSPIFIE